MISRFDIFHKFMIDNGFIIVSEDYGCCILSEFITSVKNKFDNIIRKFIQDGGYKEIQTPFFVHEDLYLYKKVEDSRYQSFNRPALIYKDGHRLKKAYIVPPSINVFSKLIFENSVHAYNALPLKVFSSTFSFNSAKISNSIIKTFEYNNFDLDCYVDSKKIEAETNQIANIVSQILNMFKIKFDKRKNAADEIFFYSKIGDTGVDLCKYKVYSEDICKQMGISYTGINGKVMHPIYITCQISDSLFWYFLFSCFDEIGFRLPVEFLPFDIVILPVLYNINDKDKEILNYISKIEEFLSIEKIRFFTDNNSESIGVKHYKWEKLGVPIQIEIGYRECRDKTIMVINRYTQQRKSINFQGIYDEIKITMNYWK